MPNEDNIAHAGITAKERLERIENMLSDLSRQLDVRFLELEHRINALDQWKVLVDERAIVAAQERKEIELEQRQGFDAISKSQVQVKSLIRWAAITLGGLVVIADALLRFFK